MQTKYGIARSALFNWAALLVGVAVSFFLSPFVVHHLGNDAYGVWTFLNSTIAFMNLLDLGLRGTVTRFVARDYARQRHDDVRSVVSTIFWFRALLGGSVLLVGVLASRVLVQAIAMPPSMHADARIALILLACSFVVTFTSGVFGGVLAALQRFDLLSGVTVGQTLLRTAGVIWILRSGHGVLALAIVDFSIVCLAALSLRGLVRYVYPQVRIERRLPARAQLKEVVGYSFYAYVINVCVQIIFYTDNVVVGTTLSAAAVTFFSVGGGLVEYLRQIVSSLTVIFTPLASSIGEDGGRQKLRELLVNGTRAVLLTALPIAAGLFFRGDTFIGLWMGPEYVRDSGQVLAILVFGALLNIANTTSSAIGLGLGRHRIVAVWAAGEALANLGLSIWLAYRLGLVGVAWGTVLPALVVHLVLWPRYICRIVEIPLGTYFWQSWLRPLIAVAPFAVACSVLDAAWVPRNLAIFFLQMFLLAPVFALGAALVFRGELGGLLQAEVDRLPAFSRRGVAFIGRVLRAGSR